MDENNQDGSGVLETTDTAEEQKHETADESEQESDAPQTDEEKEQLRREVEELRKKNSQLYERAKKKEAQESPSGMSLRDVLALKDADVSADDLEDVQEYAAFKKISIAEALKSPTLKTILGQKAEERKTALATATKGGAKAISKTTGEDLLRRAETTGELPSDDASLQKLIEARREKKIARATKRR